MSAKSTNNKMIPTKHSGVYQRVSDTKKFDGKPDACFYITYKMPNGKKVWEKIGWRSEKITAAFAAELRIERVRNLRLGDTSVPTQRRKEASITFGDAWAIFDEKWLPNLKRADMERKFYTSYLKPVLGNRPLSAITPMELEDLKNSLLKRGLAPASVKLIVGNVRRVYNKMYEWDLYSGPKPMDRVKLPKVDNARDRFLTADEAQTLLAAVKKRSQLWHDVSLISLNTGMRLSEILGLRPQDVDLKNSVLHLEGKTGRRSIPVNDLVHETLERVVAGKNGLEFLFPSKKGTQLGSDSATNSFARAVADAGLNPPNVDRRHKVVFHTLRHTYCSWLAMEGVPLYVIGEMVGHSSPDMTKRYSHLCPDKKSQTVALVQGIFSKGQATETVKRVIPRHKKI
ncbi:site-specific integrase [Desulfovibrio sp. OttesenSCG-928-C14]|nr:site-specific integrase [Desulfovibrio sp. OttesenSCG-928-C14]